MVVNHFKMRTDVLSHNLSGMGCSSGVIGIDMAKNYLQVGARPARPASLFAMRKMFWCQPTNSLMGA